MKIVGDKNNYNNLYTGGFYPHVDQLENNENVLEYHYVNNSNQENEEYVLQGYQTSSTQSNRNFTIQWLVDKKCGKFGEIQQAFTYAEKGLNEINPETRSNFIKRATDLRKKENNASDCGLAVTAVYKIVSQIAFFVFLAFTIVSTGAFFSGLAASSVGMTSLGFFGTLINGPLMCSSFIFYKIFEAWNNSLKNENIKNRLLKEEHGNINNIYKSFMCQISIFDEKFLKTKSHFDLFEQRLVKAQADGDKTSLEDLKEMAIVISGLKNDLMVQNQISQNIKDAIQV